jgi:hypothetical protein
LAVLHGLIQCIYLATLILEDSCPPKVAIGEEAVLIRMGIVLSASHELKTGTSDVLHLHAGMACLVELETSVEVPAVEHSSAVQPFVTVRIEVVLLEPTGLVQ